MLGFVLAFPLTVAALNRFFFFAEGALSPPERATKIVDRLTAVLVIATIAGARLGHFLFYERPSEYLNNPWELFQTWKGGLASHGAAIGIALGLWYFRCRIRAQEPALTWIRLLDLIAAPIALVGTLIRIGNFWNQEILGTAAKVPWAVIFGHPADHSRPLPRHPVQLYEAAFYLAVFVLLWRLSHRREWLLRQGRLMGVFLIAVFGFRLCIEFLKIEQSHLMSAWLNMGQILSLPLILVGFWFIFYHAKK
jgi:prolipoprotein diacylglyceryl transferase